MNYLQIMGGRKYTLCVLTLIITSILTACSVVDAGTYSTVILGTVGGFILGSVSQDVGIAKFGKPNETAPSVEAGK